MNQNITRKNLIVFELIWAFIFLVVAIQPLFKANGVDSFATVIDHSRLWAFITAGCFIAVAVTYPALLTGFYKIWVKFGALIGGIISKIVLVVLFFAVVTPIGLVMRATGKDLLQKKLDKSAKSYWVKRETQPGTLKNQF